MLLFQACEEGVISYIDNNHHNRYSRLKNELIRDVEACYKRDFNLLLERYNKQNITKDEFEHKFTTLKIAKDHNINTIKKQFALLA